MIQRIQSILLFLAAGLCVAFLFFPTWHVSAPDLMEGNDKTLTAYPTGVAVHASTMGLEQTWTDSTLPVTENFALLGQMILVILTAIIALATIFLYKNRPLQVKLGYLAIFLLMAVNILMIPIRNWLEGMNPVDELMQDVYQSIPQWGLGAPLVALLLVWFAVKRIQRDEKLVQGMDRIR